MVKPHTKICSNEDDEIEIVSNKENKVVDFDIINEKLILKYKNINDDNNNIGSLVRFSSYITAIARSNLDIMMASVGYENVYYCDTDSVFISKKPDSSLLDNNELGKWKLEKKGDIDCIINEALFLAPKTYTYTCKDENIYEIKAKGNRTKDIKKHMKDNNINCIDLLKNGNVEIKNDCMFIRTLSSVKIIE